MTLWIWRPDVLFTCYVVVSLVKRGEVESTDSPYSSKMISILSFKEDDIKAVPNTMTCCRYASETSTDDRDLWTMEFGSWWWGIGRKDSDQEPLYD